MKKPPTTYNLPHSKTSPVTSTQSPPPKQSPRVAIVHDWLNSRGGAERVVAAMHKAFPEAPIYTSIYDAKLFPEFKGADIRTTWLQKFPKKLRKLHKLFPVLRVWAFRSLNLNEFDIIFSSSSAESKQVKKRADALQICYCHTPIRYYWNAYDEYRKHPPFGKLNPFIKPFIPLFVTWMRKLDYASAQKVDYFIANSTTVQARIKKYYNKDSVVIHPPVDTNRFTKLSEPSKRVGFVALGRQEPYKRIDLAVKACTQLGLYLTVYGNGSEHQKLVQMAGPTITFRTDADDNEVALGLKSAQAFIFPAEEDFGIVQVEALAAGTPVIAYAKGGALDIVVDGTNGVLFHEQTVESLIRAVEKSNHAAFGSKSIAKTALKYENRVFIDTLKNYTSSVYER